MILGMFASALVAVFGLLVALGQIGHPIDAQAISPFGWSVLIVGAALFGLCAFRRYTNPPGNHPA